jgi:hypothetical protein
MNNTNESVYIVNCVIKPDGTYCIEKNMVDGGKSILIPVSNEWIIFSKTYDRMAKFCADGFMTPGFFSIKDNIISLDVKASDFKKIKENIDKEEERIEMERLEKEKEKNMEKEKQMNYD